jgi:hypothetical protein
VEVVNSCYVFICIVKEMVCGCTIIQSVNIFVTSCGAYFVWFLMDTNLCLQFLSVMLYVVIIFCTQRNITPAPTDQTCNRGSCTEPVSW